MFKENAKNIKLLLLDVDGVMTDGRIVMGATGELCKNFSAMDGLGITLAQANGLQIGIITGRTSQIVANRAAELHIELLYQGVSNKAEVLKQILAAGKYRTEQIAVMGDDLNDLPMLKMAKLAIAPANAAIEIRERAHYICHKSGGQGAVREAIEFILKNQGKWNNIIRKYLVQTQGDNNAILSDKISQ